MKFDFLNFLKCPFCGSRFEIEEAVTEVESELINGCVKCDCNKFPILEGILLIKEFSLDDCIKLIKERRINEATVRYIWSERFIIGNYLKRLDKLSLRFPPQSLVSFGKALSSLAEKFSEGRLKKKYERFSKQQISFIDLLETETKKGDLYPAYMKHRFSTETFWSLYPFLPLLKRKNEKVLDIACGGGHASFVLSNYINLQQLCSVDISFKHLFYAKKYFAPKAQFICLDAGLPLPFDNGIFNSILMSDAFGYVDSRVSLAREMKRCLVPEGLLLLLHVHNSLTFNLGQGHPLTPKSCLRLFNDVGIKVKVMPERKIIHDFIIKNKLDLLEDYTEDELNSSNGLILMATDDGSLFKVHDNVDKDFLSIKSNLIINPIYRVEKKDDKFLLERPVSACCLGDHYPFSEEYLPKKIELDGICVKDNRQLCSFDAQKVEELMKKFILLNVPENYV
ncbi:MAG: methyltransferase domain-containing protein [Candidatus Bathyarchaeota archaeon]|nr:methyltransferase domain-containing protein [Candidatus Bathyarchaeota archaeon]